MIKSIKVKDVFFYSIAILNLLHFPQFYKNNIGSWATKIYMYFKSTICFLNQETWHYTRKTVNIDPESYQQIKYQIQDLKYPIPTKMLYWKTYQTMRYENNQINVA